MSQLHHDIVRNRLLAALTPMEFERLAPSLERVSMSMGQPLVMAREPITHGYFPEDGLVSLICDTVEGRVEIGLVGYEGFVGTPLVLGTGRTPHNAMVQAEGSMLRIGASDLQAALEASPALRGVLGRYVQSLIVQVGETVYANADCTIEIRLARWILMTQDRLRRNELPLTHDFMALMLGVRRPGVTTAMHVLEGRRMIQARRGRVIVLDRDQLKDLARDTYGTAEAEYERLLGEAEPCRATSSTHVAAAS